MWRPWASQKNHRTELIARCDLMQYNFISLFRLYMSAISFQWFWSSQTPRFICGEGTYHKKSCWTELEVRTDTTQTKVPPSGRGTTDRARARERERSNLGFWIGPRRHKRSLALTRASLWDTFYLPRGKIERANSVCVFWVATYFSISSLSTGLGNMVCRFY